MQTTAKTADREKIVATISHFETCCQDVSGLNGSLEFPRTLTPLVVGQLWTSPALARISWRSRRGVTPLLS